MSKLNRDNVELGIVVGTYAVSAVASTVEAVIKHRAIFKKDGISEEEKQVGRTACYTKWITGTISTVCSIDIVNRAVKEAQKAAEVIDNNK